jgi:hypothetical protein
METSAVEVWRSWRQNFNGGWSGSMKGSKIGGGRMAVTFWGLKRPRLVADGAGLVVPGPRRGEWPWVSTTSCLCPGEAC